LAKAGLEKVTLKCTLFRLERLDVSNNRIGWLGVKYGGGQTSLPALQWLNLSSNAMLLEARFPDCFPQLSDLDISGNRLSSF
jgi:Leucine-rich repeat (LRR) protein